MVIMRKSFFLIIEIILVILFFYMTFNPIAYDITWQNRQDELNSTNLQTVHCDMDRSGTDGNFTWELYVEFYDYDGDGLYDTADFKCKFSANRTGELNYDLKILIYRWNDTEYDLVLNETHNHYEAIIPENTVSLWQYHYEPNISSDYQLELYLINPYNETCLDNITVFWDNADVIASYYSIEFFDVDMDEQNDTCVITYYFIASISGEQNFDMQGLVYWWNGTDFVLEVNVTENHYFAFMPAGTCALWIYSYTASKIGDYQLESHIFENNTGTEIANLTFFWSDVDNGFWAVKYFDTNIDGMNDTIKITYYFTASVSGEQNYDVQVLVYWWNNSHYKLILNETENHYEAFMPAGTSIHWNYNYTVIESGDYRIECYIFEHTNKTLINNLTLFWINAVSLLEFPVSFPFMFIIPIGITLVTMVSIIFFQKRQKQMKL